MGDIIGGILGSNSAEDAAEAQIEASQSAAAQEMEQYYQTREDLAPWRQTGQRALTQMEQLMGLAPAQTQTSVASPEQQLNQSQFDYLLSQLGSGGTGGATATADMPPNPNDYGGTFGNTSYLAALREYNQRIANEREEFGGMTQSEFQALQDRLSLGASIPTDLTAQQRDLLGIEGTEDTGYYYPGGATQAQTVAQTENAPATAATGDVAEAGQDQYSAFYNSPGYQFRLQEGLKALQRSAAAKGNLQSGATMKGITEYGQGVASQEFGNYYNRLAGLAGTGQTTTTQTAQLGQQAAAGAGNTLTQGAARASGYETQAGQQMGAGIGTAINTGLGFLLSDINAKENIKFAEDKNGFSLYEFNYKGDNRRYKGVIAQEVQETHPDAVIRRPDGYLAVNYDKLGLRMEVA